MNLLADTVVDKASNSSSFGCCHRYRQCSDAKRCLLAIEDEQRAKQCTYRYKLEQGLIFYGKNANDFAMEQYTALLGTYNNMDGALRRILDDIILYLVGGSYLSCDVLWFYTAELEQLQSLGFITYHRNYKRLLENYSVKELKAAVDTNSMKKEDLIKHIISEQPDALTKLSAPYCYVQIPHYNRRYIFEIYYDFFYTTSHNRYTGPLPFPKKEKKAGGAA